MASRKSGKKKSSILFLNFKKNVNNLHIFEKGSYTRYSKQNFPTY
jgi:hypothetical protein